MPLSGEDFQARFRRLAEEAAISVTDCVMKSVSFHFASQMMVVNTPDDAAHIYRQASRIPRSATEIALREMNIDVGGICPGTYPSNAIILEAFKDGSPCLLKITDPENVDHEVSVWKAIEGLLSSESDSKIHHLVPLQKLEFERSAVLRNGNLSGGHNEISGDYRSGILMENYPSALSRCKIPLREAILIKYGEQLQQAVTMMHKTGYCHMDIKPSNIFISSGGHCLLGDYGGATKIGDPVREHTRAYYPTDAGRYAKTETDYQLLTVTLLELFGMVTSPPSPMTAEQIQAKVAGLENRTVKAFLSQLLEGTDVSDRETV